MPALKIYGRRWHMASDMMPIPALAALVIHTIWIIIFGPIVGAYHVFGDRNCHRPGVQYQAVCGGFLAIYAVSWVFELALFVVGCRGMALCCCQGREAIACFSVQLSLSPDLPIPGLLALQAPLSRFKKGKQLFRCSMLCRFSG